MEKNNLTRKWDTKELLRLVGEKYGKCQKDAIKEHVEALKWNESKVLLHKEEIVQRWDAVQKKSEVNSSSPEYKNAYMFSLAEGEAIVQALHPTADILAQIINIIILSPGALCPEDVSFGDVQAELRKRQKAPGVLSKMYRFSKSPEFLYVKAFCNTIKHRKLVDATYFFRLNIIKEKNIQGLRFKGFDYKRKQYPEVFLNDIYGGYAQKIFSHRDAIENKLNVFLNALNRECSG